MKRLFTQDTFVGAISAGTGNVVMDLTGDANLSRLTGLGTGFFAGGKTNKVFNSLDNVSDSVKALNHIDDVTDVTKALDDVTDVTKALDDVTDSTRTMKSFSDLMSPEDAARYNKFLENGSTAGLTQSEVKALQNVDDAIALNKVNYDDLLDLRRNTASIEDVVGNTNTFDDYMKLVEKLDVSTEPNTATFYSGPGNRELAEEFAKINGKTTLEMTSGGKYLDDLKLFEQGSPLTGDQAAEVWKRLSQRYAENATGNTYAFVKGSNPNSIFNTVEYPALTRNPNINNVFSELIQ